MKTNNNKPSIPTHILAVCALALISSCTNPPSAGGGGGTGIGLTDANQPKKPVFVGINHKDVCFLNTSGAANQDTLKVHLRVEGERVTGTMEEMIFEKDAKVGTLEGAMIGDAIDVTWNYLQEGQPDTMALDFQYSLDTLRQRPYLVDGATGRQITNVNAPYSIKLRMIDCGSNKPDTLQ